MNNGWSRVNIGQRKFRSQTSDNMDRWKKQRWEELEKRREETRRDETRGEENRREEKRRREEDQRREDKRREEKRRGQKKEEEGSRKGRKVATQCFSDGSFGSLDVEKVHAVLARSTFGSQNGKTDHFWKLRCGKSARPCGAKHISKSNGLGPLFEVGKVHAVVARSIFRSQRGKKQLLKIQPRHTTLNYNYNCHNNNDDYYSNSYNN